MAANWPPAELVQSLTYRESYMPQPVRRPYRALTAGAPAPLRTAAAAGWALVSLITATSVAVVVALLLVKVAGALT